MNKLDEPHLIWFVPIFMLLLASAISLPETYYQLLRLDVFTFVLYLLWQQYKLDRKASFWMFFFIFIIVTFNPFYVLPFSKFIWVSLDWIAITLLIWHLIIKSKRRIWSLNSLW